MVEMGILRGDFMETMMKNEYFHNSYFRNFVNEYCNKNRITIDEAFKEEEIKKLFLRLTDL